MRDTELYGVRPTKGTIPTGQRMICFDAVRPCRDTACPLHPVCPYPRGGKCQVETKYLEAVRRNLVQIPGNKMTQEFMDKVSLHLMPLFHQLIKFQIRAYAVEDCVYQTANGMMKVHPIFPEIRKTIAAIESTQKSLGIDLEYHRALGLVRGISKATRERDPDAYGDPDYAEAMATETDEMKAEIASAIIPDGPRTGVRRHSAAEEEDDATTD